MSRLTLALTAAGAALSCAESASRGGPGGIQGRQQSSCVTAVDASDDDGHGPENAIDGDLSTRWSSLGEGEWIAADLGQARDVCGVSIAWYRGTERKNDFRIETSSDGVAWTQRSSGTSSGKTLKPEPYAFGSTTARWVRVVVDGNTDNDWASITELEVATCGSPLPIAAVSAGDDDGNVPSNVLDGDLQTRWSSEGEGSWLVADLGAPQEIGGVAIAWYKGDARRSDFRIELSTDASAWHEAYSGESSGATVTLEPYAFAAATARYVRLTVDGNTQNDWASVTELAVLDAAATCDEAEPPAATTGDDGAAAETGGETGGETGEDTGGGSGGGACGDPAVDANGVAYLALPGFSYSGGIERSDWTENFKSNGSMRHDFEGATEGNQCVLGYFVVDGPGDEEISAKLGGGPHNDDHASWADTHDLGIVNFAGDEARLRFEEEHPDYSDELGSSVSFDVGDVRGKWVGAMGCKLNVDANGDGEIDHVRYLAWVDPEGLDDAGKPSNGWVPTFDLELPIDEVELKSPTVPYVTTIGHEDEAQATIRIDEQDEDDYQYRFVTYRSPVPCP